MCNKRNCVTCTSALSYFWFFLFSFNWTVGEFCSGWLAGWLVAPSVSVLMDTFARTEAIHNINKFLAHAEYHFASSQHLTCDRIQYIPAFQTHDNHTKPPRGYCRHNFQAFRNCVNRNCQEERWSSSSSSGTRKKNSIDGTQRKVISTGSRYIQWDNKHSRARTRTTQTKGERETNWDRLLSFQW